MGQLLWGWEGRSCPIDLSCPWYPPDPHAHDTPSHTLASSSLLTAGHSQWVRNVTLETGLLKLSNRIGMHVAHWSFWPTPMGTPLCTPQSPRPSCCIHL